MSLNEFDAIARYFQWPTSESSVTQSIGDDCALLATEKAVLPGQQLALSMDTMVAGVHFPRDAAAGDIASRAFCAALSDLAAMGAKPLWFTLGLTLPDTDEQWLSEFSQSLKQLSDEYHCAPIGGDTTRGPLTVTLQVHGVVERPLLRNGAQAGDTVFVTGTIGDGAAALSLLNDKIIVDASMVTYLKQRFYRPRPQIQVGRLLVDKANSAIDISDGLLADLQHIATASQVDIEIQLEHIPVSDAYQAVMGEDAIDVALTAGDDYQLAFTVSAQNRTQINVLIQQKRLAATIIGQVLPCQQLSPQVRCSLNGQIHISSVKGYQHFAS